MVPVKFTGVFFPKRLQGRQVHSVVSITMKRGTDLQLLYFKIFNFFQPLQTNYNIKIKVRHKGFYLRTPIAFDSKNSSLPKFWGPGIFGSLVILLFFRCHQKDLKLWSVVSGPFCHVLSAYNAWFLDELPIREYLMKYQSPISSNFPLQSVEVQSVFGATHEILLDSRNPMSGCLKLSHRDKG